MEAVVRGSRPLAVAVLALALSLVALPASANPNEYTYDALGDSFAAGTGVAASQAYPAVLDGRMSIQLDDHAAVSGATVQSMLATQLVALDAETDLVTMTVGGNNVGWTQTVIACLQNSDAVCSGAVAQSNALIGGVLPGLLDAAFTQVRMAAPDAHVVVTGYPRLFTPKAGAYTGQLIIDVGGTQVTLPFEASVAEQHLMNAAADNLNAVLRAKAAEHGFQFVDVTKRFDGNGVNAKKPMLFGVFDPVPFHPNADGQKAYGQALTSSIKPSQLG